MEHELDLENPLTVDHDDGVSCLLTNESDHMPRLLSLDPSDLRFSIRRTALSLIAQAKFSYGLDPFLVYLSVNYVDRFLSKQEIRDKSPWIPQILFVASLSLAAKMINSDSSSLLLALLQRGSSFSIKFEAESVNRMEKIILAALQWRMRSITPFSFLNHFLSLLNHLHSSLTLSLKTRASHIIFNVQHEFKVLEYKPSTIAASALLCAVEDLNPLTFSSSKIALSSCQYVNKDALLECMAAITETSPASALMSGTSSNSNNKKNNPIERKRTSSISEESCGFPETNNVVVVKQRRLNLGLCDNRATPQVSQIQENQLIHHLIL